MKAAIYNPYLDTLGGGERYTLSLANALAEEGYFVDFEWNEKDILSKMSQRFGINVLKNVNVIDDIRRGDNYDICFWVSDGSIPMLRAKRNFIHFQVPFKNVNGKSLFNRMKLFRVEKIICNSRFTKSVIDEEYGVKSVVVYPPVNIENIKPLKKEKLILYVGRFSNLVQNKGQLYLIQAFKKLKESEEFKDWKLVLAGGIEIGADEFVDLVRNEIGDTNVELSLSPQHKTIIELYGRATFFWSATGFGVDENENPKDTEHFGISLVEAMAGRCVPFVYNGGGFKEIVDNKKSGFLWNNLDELIEETKLIFKNKKEMTILSKTAREVSKKYSYEEFKKQIKSIL